MRVIFTRKSENMKTGHIPVTITGAQSCPVSCPLLGKGCYALNGFLVGHWAGATAGTRGVEWDEFVAKVKALPEGQLWRHNQAGDLPGDGVHIDTEKLDALAIANIGKRGFTYTHYDPKIGENGRAIKRANDWGFRINLSANNLRHADKLADLGIGPVVTILPIDAPNELRTPAGRRVTVCPAVRSEGVTCKLCKLCQKDRDVIVGFPAHGSQAKAADLVAKGVE